RIGGGLGSLEGVRHSESNVLAVIADDIVLEWWTPLITDAFESRPEGRPGDLSDVPAMKDHAHAWHRLSRGGVQLDHSAFGDRRLDRHGIEHSGKTEVGGVLRQPADLERAIHSRGVPTNRRTGRGFLCGRHVRSFGGISLSPPSAGRA